MEYCCSNFQYETTHNIIVKKYLMDYDYSEDEGLVAKDEKSFEKRFEGYAYREGSFPMSYCPYCGTKL